MSENNSNYTNWKLVIRQHLLSENIWGPTFRCKSSWIADGKQVHLKWQMEEANIDTDLEINYHSEASMGDKRKREGKLRSKVWEHFTKIMKEDGRCDKCQCNHCQKLFTCSSRSGTTHLLRHITDGICPVFKNNKDKTMAISSYLRGGTEQRNNLLPWKFDQGSGQSSTPRCMDVEVELAPETLTNLESQPFKTNGDDYIGQTPLPRKLPLQSALKSHPRGEAWMNEFRSCVAKLVELTNGRIPVGSLAASGPSPGPGPDYSISVALKCLNEMEDILSRAKCIWTRLRFCRMPGKESVLFVCRPSRVGDGSKGCCIVVIPCAIVLTCNRVLWCL
ncbi:hypothetical protein DH2020_008536 [Rehmannia glutinosa]|uniref:BED-type domain-containing protein n=1 Tax=Rehmannia glutinosa TaxID=99300 RepID=A0ABR0X3P7_REHGL